MESIDRWRNPRMLALSVLSLLSLTPVAHAAWYINPSQLPEVRRLAHVVQMESARALADAQGSIDWRDPAEQNALNALGGLAQISSSLDRELELQWTDPNQVDTLLTQTQQANARVQATSTQLPTYAYDAQLFREIEDAVVELSMLRSDNGGGYPGPIPGPIVGGNAQAIAHALDDGARDLLVRAESESSYSDYWRQNAVRELQSLAATADRLYQELSYGNIGQARADLGSVQVQLDSAREAIVNARWSQWVLDALNRVNRDATDLSGALSGGYGVAVPVPAYPVVVPAYPVVVPARPVFAPGRPVVVVHH